MGPLRAQPAMMRMDQVGKKERREGEGEKKGNKERKELSDRSGEIYRSEAGKCMYLSCPLAFV